MLSAENLTNIVMSREVDYACIIMVIFKVNNLKQLQNLSFAWSLMTPVCYCCSHIFFFLQMVGTCGSVAEHF
jgi:hypothetical protein